ncbi:PorT family protein [Brachyspira hyodysenteriae]|uniref:PorT family protein n=1 Tax=Brachyspira hyodysenteriae TaxID=159 RepID=UPI002B2600C1|nr:PorT family protein [Brachyspira hyodysenteriae]WPC37684.1 PorT family protein [Brachyspira hyodysenteriae]
MVNIKKIILVFIIASVSALSLSAASGFEAIINVPIGLSVGFQNYKLTKEAERYKDYIKNEVDLNSSIGFDIGVSAQLGYMIQVKEGFGISVLAEIGYSHDSYSFTFVNNKKENHSFTTESLQVGLLPKFNIGAFSIGVGGGVKIPFVIKASSKYDGKKMDSPINFDKKISNNIKSPVMGYVKLTFDYSIFFTDYTAFNIGLYAGYDFGFSMTDKVLRQDAGNKTFEYMNFSSFDIGLQLGFKFGPKA